MNDEIIALAKEAKAMMLHGGEYALMGNASIKSFYNLVAAKERENWPAEMKAMENQVNILTDALGEAVWIYSEAVKKEREAIYQIVSHAPFTEAFDDGELQSEIGDALKSMAFSICAAIRARGEQK